MENPIPQIMPTYPIFHCRVCKSAVQIESSPAKNFFPMYSSSNPLILSSELDSDDFPRYCRGQGKFYASRASNKFALPTGAFDHFNFSGYFQGMCCYCALGDGLSPDSFAGLSCYHCMQRFHTVSVFSKLKNKREESAISEGSDKWKSSGWSGLSDSLIDHILQLALGNETKLVS